GVAGYEGIHYEPGKPQLPVVRFYVEGDVEVSVASEEKRWINKTAAPLVPAQPSRVKLPAASVPFLKDAAAYSAKSLMPAVSYRIDDAGSIRGVERKLVTLYPLRYAAGGGNYALTSD